MKKTAIVSILAILAIFTVQPAYASLTDGLRGHYFFSTNADDSSAYGNDGTASGATLAADRFNESDSAYSFDGTDGYISVPSDTSLNFGTGDFSISFWIKPDNLSGIQTIIDKRDNSSGYHGYCVFVNGGYIGIQMADGSYSNFYTITTSISTSSWNHVVITIDRDSTTGGKIYISNKVDYIFDPTSRSSSIDTSGNLYFGKNFVGSGFLVGDLDDVRIYNRVLSENEIEEIYYDGRIDYIGVAGIGDKNSNGYSDIATLLVSGGNAIVRINDSNTGAQIGDDLNFFDSDWIPKSIAIVDYDNDNGEDITVLAVNPTSLSVAVKIWDTEEQTFRTVNMPFAE